MTSAHVVTTEPAGQSVEVRVAGQLVARSADPVPSAQQIAGRLAFWEGKPGIEILVVGRVGLEPTTDGL